MDEEIFLRGSNWTCKTIVVLRFILCVLVWLDTKFKKSKKTFESCGLKIKMCIMYQMPLHLVVYQMPLHLVVLNKRCAMLEVKCYSLDFNLCDVVWFGTEFKEKHRKTFETYSLKSLNGESICGWSLQFVLL